MATEKITGRDKIHPSVIANRFNELLDDLDEFREVVEKELNKLREDVDNLKKWKNAKH